MEFVELGIIWFKAEYADNNFELITVFDNSYNNAYVVTQVLREALKTDLIGEHGALIKLSVIDSEYNIIKTVFSM